MRTSGGSELGPDDRQTLYLRFHVASVLRSQGRYAEALDEDTDILAMQKAVLSATTRTPCRRPARWRATCAGLASSGRRWTWTSETYDRFKELFGDDEPTTLSAANNLAIDLRLVGDCFQALQLDQDTLNRRQSVLGPNHPYSLHSASMLARDMREAGDFAGSTELLRETYARYRTVLGEDVVDTLRTAKSLAVSLRKIGETDEAYRLSQETRQRYVQNYAPEHPDALACQLNLACDLSRDDKASALDRRVRGVRDLPADARRQAPVRLGGRE